MSSENLDNKIFISFLDDDDKIVSGWFYLLESNTTFIKFRTLSGSVLTIPFIRVLKIKEKGDNGFS